MNRATLERIHQLRAAQETGAKSRHLERLAHAQQCAALLVQAQQRHDQVCAEATNYASRLQSELRDGAVAARRINQLDQHIAHLRMRVVQARSELDIAQGRDAQAQVDLESGRAELLRAQRRREHFETWLSRDAEQLRRRAEVVQ